jgi:hypothetical protein
MIERKIVKKALSSSGLSPKRETKMSPNFEFLNRTSGMASDGKKHALS